MTLAGYTPTQKHARKPVPREKKHHRRKQAPEITIKKLKAHQKQRKPLYSTRISRICNLTPQSYATTPWYPGWDSNPYWIDFKSTASADWATGAYAKRIVLRRVTSYRLAPRLSPLPSAADHE